MYSCALFSHPQLSCTDLTELLAKERQKLLEMRNKCKTTAKGNVLLNMGWAVWPKQEKKRGMAKGTTKPGPVTGVKQEGKLTPQEDWNVNTKDSRSQNGTSSFGKVHWAQAAS